MQIVQIHGEHSNVNVHQAYGIHGQIKYNVLAVNVFHVQIHIVIIVAPANMMRLARNWFVNV